MDPTEPIPILSYAPPRTDRTYAWLVVAMLWFVCLFNYADRQAIFSVFPLLKSRFNLSDLQLGIIGSSFMWVYAAAGPLAGLVGDRVSRKALILGGLIFWSLITLATAFSTRYPHLILFRALEGLGEAFYFPASMSLISDYHGPKTRSRAMAIHQSSVYAGTILGGSASGILGQYFGWKSGFYVFGIAGIILALLLTLMLREIPRGRDEPQTREPQSLPNEDVLTSLFAFFANPMAILLMAIFIGANSVAAVFLTWMPSYLRTSFGMSLAAAGVNATLWMQMMSVVGVICGGIFADQLAKKIAGGRMLTQAAGLLLGFPFIALAGLTRSVPILVAAMSGFGFFKGLYDANIWAALYDVVPLNRRAVSVGLMNAVGWLGASAAPIAIAYTASQYGMGPSISATSLIYLGLAFAMAATARLKKGFM
ncbi:MAG TPA: MFS transporter [Humisphaera sp.]|jgi:MFS family permease|nr:MFS transporter [Humisphaera sp.]